MHPSALIDIVGQMSTRKFAAGEILLREGEMAEALAVVMDGVVRILGAKRRPQSGQARAPRTR